ncbi:MAG: MBL fold metallo-hydrolase [Alphaproteobacteria bacterium]|nr:MBL fold metallo-hydrolase [Alphaproteobacteria bacterium]
MTSVPPHVLEEVAPGLRRIAVRTPTLPPATHTNCYIAGHDRLTVFDPASPWDDEQAVLAGALDALEAQGARVERIVLTHHHVDHVSGAQALQAHLAAGDRTVPIVAHEVTRTLLSGVVPVDGVLADGDTLACDDVRFAVVHTPGHAPGHLVFHDPASGAVVAGDMVAGIGTILIDPVEGDLGDYLDSLVRMQRLDPALLLPSHGPALPEARAVLGFYVAHRHQRTEQIRRALAGLGVATPVDLAPRVYPELPSEALAFGAVQILAHLTWMVRHGLAAHAGDPADLRFEATPATP